MFIGRYHSKIDEQSRLTVSADFRQLLSEGSFVIQGFDRNLMVLTANAFRELCRLITAKNIADPLTRLLLRMTLGSASRIEVDGSGRITIPPDLREFAGLVNETILVGQGDYFEVWAPATWNDQEACLNDADANKERFAGLDLAKR